MPWYAVNTKPHQEERAKSCLRQLSIETFLPLLRESKVIRRTRKMVIGPLFPGYLFARFDLKERSRAVSYARGVRKIVEFGSKAVEVDVALIEAIMATVDNDQVVRQAENWKNGQPVQIIDGPLGGLKAVFVRELPGEQRALLLLQALGFRARVVMNIEQLNVRIAV